MSALLDATELRSILHEARVLRQSSIAKLHRLKGIAAPVLVAESKLGGRSEPESAVVLRLAQDHRPASTQRPARIKAGPDQRRRYPSPSMRIEHGDRGKPNTRRPGLGCNRAERHMTNDPVLINRDHRHRESPRAAERIDESRFCIVRERRGIDEMDRVFVLRFFVADLHALTSEDASFSRGTGILHGPRR